MQTKVLTIMQERHRLAAMLAADYDDALDLFERLEIELGEAEAAVANDHVTQARRRLEARRMTT